jgi:c-di-AMP phosphodiesterase-like protein
MKPNNLSEEQIKKAEQNSSSYLFDLAVLMQNKLYVHRYYVTFFVNSSSFITFKCKDKDGRAFLNILQNKLDDYRAKYEITYFYYNEDRFVVNVKFEILERFMEEVK